MNDPRRKPRPQCRELSPAEERAVARKLRLRARLRDKVLCAQYGVSRGTLLRAAARQGA